MRDLAIIVTLVTSTFAVATRSSAAITKVSYERTAFEDGRAFGSVGAYEMISGRLFGEIDPDDPHNSVIVDVDKAPRNARGRVEYEAEFIVLRPRDAGPDDLKPTDDSKAPAIILIEPQLGENI